MGINIRKMIAVAERQLARAQRPTEKAGPLAEEALVNLQHSCDMAASYASIELRDWPEETRRQ